MMNKGERRFDNKKPYGKKPFDKRKPFKPKEEKFDIEKWIKKNLTAEQPKRGRRNSLEGKKNKRR